MESPIQHKKARSGTFRHEYTKLIINELRLYHFSLGTFGQDNRKEIWERKEYR